MATVKKTSYTQVYNLCIGTILRITSVYCSNTHVIHAPAYNRIFAQWHIADYLYDVTAVNHKTLLHLPKQLFTKLPCRVVQFHGIADY